MSFKDGGPKKLQLGAVPVAAPSAAPGADSQRGAPQQSQRGGIFTFRTKKNTAAAQPPTKGNPELGMPPKPTTQGKGEAAPEAGKQVLFTTQAQPEPEDDGKSFVGSRNTMVYDSRNSVSPSPVSRKNLNPKDIAAREAAIRYKNSTPPTGIVEYNGIVSDRVHGGSKVRQNASEDEKHSNSGQEGVECFCVGAR